ncbi:cupredoxin domain-containing protein [Kribbella rubisoli]|uniref:cupredoxin domain-containing protein n=1 Tax=Kribbella rubisoli TaxID=3075929 RepID=UPI00102ACD56|nr:plastocyanin/azurin family copper-binding protein [Kribbella rubisoli]
MRRAGKSSGGSGRSGRWVVVLAVVIGLLGLMGGCGSGSDGGGAAPAPTTTSASGGGSPAAGGGTMVEVKNFAFMPANVTVPVGGKVTWKFDDSTAHTVTADDNSFSSSPMQGGQTFSHTFTTAGTVKYHCSIHPEMIATIVVK